MALSGFLAPPAPTVAEVGEEEREVIGCVAFSFVDVAVVRTPVPGRAEAVVAENAVDAVVAADVVVDGAALVVLVAAVARAVFVAGVVAFVTLPVVRLVVGEAEEEVPVTRVAVVVGLLVVDVAGEGEAD